MLLLLALIVGIQSQIYDQQQLTNAACVILSRFYLNSQQQRAGEALGYMVQNGLSKEEGILAMQAATVEKCLDTITQDETTQLMQGLQTQNLEFDSFVYIVESTDIKKYGNKKKSQKKTEMLRVIKSIDDLIQQQKKEFDDGGGEPEELKPRKGGKKQNTGKPSALPDISLFEFKEYFVMISFIFVGILLSYIMCCLPDKKPKQKKSKQVAESTKSKED